MVDPMSSEEELKKRSVLEEHVSIYIAHIVSFLDLYAETGVMEYAKQAELASYYFKRLYHECEDLFEDAIRSAIVVAMEGLEDGEIDEKSEDKKIRWRSVFIVELFTELEKIRRQKEGKKKWLN